MQFVADHPLVQPIFVGGLIRHLYALLLEQQAYHQLTQLSVPEGSWTKVAFLERQLLDCFFAFAWLFAFESHFYRVLVWEFVDELPPLRHVFVEDVFLLLVALRPNDAVKSPDYVPFI